MTATITIAATKKIIHFYAHELLAFFSAATK